MKLFKSFYIHSLLLVILIFSACQDQEPEYYAGDSDNFRFAKKFASISENSTDIVSIAIIYSKGTPKTGTATVSITGGVEGFDYEVLNPSLTFDFAADQYIDSIFIRPIDNSVENEPLLLNLELTASERIGWTGDTESQICVVSINDDDGCPDYQPILFIGTIDGVNTDGQSGLQGLDAIDGAFISEITLAGDDDLTVTNLGGIFDTFTNGGAANPDPCTVTLIPGVGGQQGDVEVSGQTGYTIGGDPILYGGTGTYDICSGSMIINWNLNYNNGDLVFLGTATYQY